jgi:formylglycine-generating enzyme
MGGVGSTGGAGAGDTGVGGSGGSPEGGAGSTDAGGSTGDASTETATPVTDAGSSVPMQSCSQPDGGVLLCNGESCCKSILVPGGTLPMGRGTEDCGAVGCQTGAAWAGCPNGLTCGVVEQPEHSMSIGTFALDKYEVTVARFRNFVNAYATGWRPTVGSGANPNVRVAGDAADNGTGWRAGWDDSAAAHANLAAGLSDFQTKLKCQSGAQTWTDSASANEDKAINCVNWYEAFAFCIWDGGRLPTEAEWEYAATGGDQNRLYPWGSNAPDCTYANFYNSGSACAGGTGAVLAVGSTPKGDGRWLHSDLAGNVWEWTLDWSGTYLTSQTDNFANTSSGSSRANRGGGYMWPATFLRAADRGAAQPTGRYYDFGLRCSRTAT